MKIAIVHDYLHQFGGAERCVQVLHELFPNAPIYTSIYNPNNFPDAFKKMDIRTSFMQNLPFIFENFRAYTALYPFAFQSFDLSEYDLIISSSSAFAKGIRKRKDAFHICYCYNPMRFAWRFNNYIQKEKLPEIFKKALPIAIAPFKIWDLLNNKSVDFFIAISDIVAKRIKNIYNRESEVIYPPIDTKKFSLSDNDGNYFLIVSRLVGYKRIDLVVEAFSKLGLPLVIAGEGPALESLKNSSKPNISFAGKVNNAEIKRLYSECRALILPGEEDFGMTPLEAAASGRPTIAFAAGGALETVIDGKTGVLFSEQSVECLMNAVSKFGKIEFDKNELRLHAEMFDKEIFKQKIRRFINENKIF